MSLCICAYENDVPLQGVPKVNLKTKAFSEPSFNESNACWNVIGEHKQGNYIQPLLINPLEKGSNWILDNELPAQRDEHCPGPILATLFLIQARLPAWTHCWPCALFSRELREKPATQLSLTPGRETTASTSQQAELHTLQKTLPITQKKPPQHTQKALALHRALFAEPYTVEHHVPSLLSCVFSLNCCRRSWKRRS